MKDESWEDLRLFLHVARAGGLTGAARVTGISAPTIGRRMLALERALGRTLFRRSQTGYLLAPDGEVLFERVKDMALAAQSVSDWQEGVLSLPIVTVSAGTWMSHFMAENLPALWTPSDGFRMCFRSTEARLDIAHREAAIGIRNARPETGNLAARPSVTVAFAPYCTRGFDQARNRNWVAVGREVGTTPSARWTGQQNDLITIWADTPRMTYELVRGGAGRGVFPCFIGDNDPELVRAGPVIGELEHVMWIVMHNDERGRPEVRTVIDRLAALFDGHRELFRGDRARAAGHFDRLS